MMQFREKGLRRRVEIEWTRPLSRGLWQVQFKTIDTLPDQRVPSVNIWRATLRIGFTKINFNKNEDAIANPFGFLVLTYSLAYHASVKNPENYIDVIRRTTESQYR